MQHLLLSLRVRLDATLQGLEFVGSNPEQERTFGADLRIGICDQAILKFNILGWSPKLTYELLSTRAQRSNSSLVFLHPSRMCNKPKVFKR